MLKSFDLKNPTVTSGKGSNRFVIRREVKVWTVEERKKEETQFTRVRSLRKETKRRISLDYQRNFKSKPK